jgi:hypothetical protein
VRLALCRLVLIFSVDKDLAGGEPVGTGAVLGPPAYRPLVFSAREKTICNAQFFPERTA